MAKTDGVARIIALAALGKDGGGSTGSTTNYLELANKPKINDVELTGNKTLEDLGINIPDLENYYTKEEINNTFPTTEAVDKTFEASWKETKEYIDSSQQALIWDGSTGDEAIALFQSWLDKYLNLRIVTPVVLKRTTYREFALTDWNYDMYDGKLYFMFAEHSYGDIKEQINYVDMYCQLDSTKKIITYINSSGMSAVLPIFRYNKNLPYQKYMALLTTNTDPYTPTSDYNPATKKYVDDELSTKIGNEQLVFAKTFNGKDNENYAKLFYQSGCTDSEVCSYFSDILTKMYTNPQATYYNQISGILLLTLPNINNGFCGVFEYYSSTRKFYSVNTEYNRSVVYEIEWSGEIDDEKKKITVSNVKINADLIKTDAPTDNQHVANKKYVDDNIKTYTAGENITISDDNVISANVSGGTDSNAVYTYYAPYSDDDWHTEENAANILQTIKDKGYSNFELCTLNGTHYIVKKGVNLQSLSNSDSEFVIMSLNSNMKQQILYWLQVYLDENNKIAIRTINEEIAELHDTFNVFLENIPGYNQESNLILQANAGNIEWDSLLDGGTFSSNIN